MVGSLPYFPTISSWITAWHSPHSGEGGLETRGSWGQDQAT